MRRKILLANHRLAAGQAITEMIVGAIVLVLVLLALTDFIFVALANQATVALAQSAARAGSMARNSSSNIWDQTSAGLAMGAIVSQFASTHKAYTVTSLKPTFSPPAGPTEVTVSLTVSAQLPVPVPFANITKATLTAQDAEPIVMLP